MTERLKAKFGDLVENGWASEGNPTRTGYFVREFRRPHGRMNAGLTWEITDGKGKFWELSPVGDHKITVTPGHQGQDEAKAASVAGQQADALEWFGLVFRDHSLKHEREGAIERLLATVPVVKS